MANLTLYDGRLQHIDVVIPSGANAKCNELISIAKAQFFAGIITPSGWLSSNVDLYVPIDSPANTFVQSSAVIATALAASRHLLLANAVLNYGHLREFKIASVTDQTANRTVTVLIGYNSRLLG